MPWRERLSKLFALSGPEKPARSGPALPGNVHRVADRLLPGLARLLDLPDTADPKVFEAAVLLGNLCRARGDIGKAAALREKVLSRKDVPPPVKAEAAFELGRDYREAGLLDRALDAYRDASRFGFSPEKISEEKIAVYADSGDFPAAAREAASLGMPHIEAFYLVRRAEEVSGNDDGAAGRLLQQAFSVSPSCPEAWRASACMHLASGNVAKACAAAEQTAGMSASGRLIFLEGVYSFTKAHGTPAGSAPASAEFCRCLARIAGKLADDAVQCCYTGFFCRAAGLREDAEQWFLKAVVLDSGFWTPRLALLSLAAEKEELSPALAAQIAFFTKEGAQARRFLCPSCGLRTDTVFSQCPRCGVWHSVAFRVRLQ